MTLRDIAAEVEAEEAAIRKEAIAQIKLYDIERANEQQAKAAKDTAGTKLKTWFLINPDEQELVDPEWGLRAFMQNGGGTRNYESPAVVKAQNPKLYERCELLGLFRFDDDAVKKAIAEGLLTHGDLEGYVHEGSRTPSLQVKKVGR